MPRVYSDWPDPDHPDGQLLFAIEDVNPDAVKHAIGQSADPNLVIRLGLEDHLTPLQLALRTGSARTAIERGDPGLEIGMTLKSGLVTPELYREGQKRVIAALVAGGADLLKPDERGLLPADNALLDGPEGAGAELAAQVIALTEQAMQASGKSYRPYLAAIFMLTGASEEHEDTEKMRAAMSAFISATAKQVHEQLGAPGVGVIKDILPQTDVGALHYWEGLASTPPDPATQPKPHQDFVLALENYREAVIVLANNTLGKQPEEIRQQDKNSARALRESANAIFRRTAPPHPEASAFSTPPQQTRKDNPKL